MDDDIVAQFSGVTGAPPEKARQYLSISDNNLEQAVELFFNTGGFDLVDADVASASTTGALSAPPVPQSHARLPGGVPSDAITVDSDEELIEDDKHAGTPGHASRRAGGADATNTPPRAQPGYPPEDDEAMARRLQDEFFGGTVEGTDGGVGGVDAEGYRAPIARTTDTLAGGPGSYDFNDADDMHAAVLEQLRARERLRRQGGGGTAAAAAGIFSQRRGPSSIWNDDNASGEARRSALAESTAGASQASAKASQLAEMYRPPFEIISRLPWDDARREGREDQKWILINVQDASVFDCQLLNRDIWKQPEIKATVKENFIFMQFAKDDPRGDRYVQFYFQNRDNPDAYPHIAIVDPRTGEQMKVWSGPPAPKPMDFLMQLHEFLDRYSLSAAAKNPVAKRKPEPKMDRQVDHMTEEEQLKMAMQNSLAGAAGATKADDPDELTRSIGDLGKGKQREDDEDDEDADMTDVDVSTPNGHASPKRQSAFASIPSTNPHTEPAADSSSTRIQFRHPNGRVVRRFLLADPVRRIYEWLKTEPLEGRTGVEFELVAMGKNLMGQLDETVDGAGLKNGTVMVEFLED